MTRTEAITLITATLPTLDDGRVEMVAAILKNWVGPSVYETLPATEKIKIDQALDHLDQGHGIPAHTVFARIAARFAPTNL